MQILLFGKTGQVATELQRCNYEGLDIKTIGRDKADLSSPASCSKIILENSADIIINAAAYTSVDKAETDEDMANIINGEAPSMMAQAAAKNGIPLIHISSDYVFDGHGKVPWKPDNKAKPLNAYGRSKLKGEEGIRASGATYIILRTSWVFSAVGNNFVKTMLRMANMQDALKIVDDQIGGPTAAADIAKTSLIMARALNAGQEVSGIYHFSGRPDVSWADFAREIFTITGRKISVESIPTSSFPTEAKRPLNSRMDCFTLNSVFGIERPRWKDSLIDVLKELEEI